MWLCLLGLPQKESWLVSKILSIGELWKAERDTSNNLSIEGALTHFLLNVSIRTKALITMNLLVHIIMHSLVLYSFILIGS